IVMVGANQALVPALSTSFVQRKAPATWKLVSQLLVGTIALGVLLEGLVIVFAGPLMRITAPGLSADQLALSTSAVPILFLVAPLVALAEIFRALLNSLYA